MARRMEVLRVSVGVEAAAATGPIADGSFEHSHVPRPHPEGKPSRLVTAMASFRDLSTGSSWKLLIQILAVGVTQARREIAGCLQRPRRKYALELLSMCLYRPARLARRAILSCPHASCARCRNFPIYGVTSMYPIFQRGILAPLRRYSSGFTVVFHSVP